MMKALQSRSHTAWAYAAGLSEFSSGLLTALAQRRLADARVPGLVVSGRQAQVVGPLSREALGRTPAEERARTPAGSLARRPGATPAVQRELRLYLAVTPGGARDTNR